MTAAGDKIAGAKMMQGIELIVVELPASGDERALIGGGRDSLSNRVSYWVWAAVAGSNRHSIHARHFSSISAALRTGYYRDPR
ncbi:hypothetical protein BANRA_05223 [Klebsiella pneumoniae]|nr:hypothetical protein BANRA_05223 [Klebsiella pneumoniae]